MRKNAGTDATFIKASEPWLNPRRIRRQALLLAIALWLGYAATIATPGMRDRFGHLKGADFLHAYVLGSIALDHRADALYDAAAQRAIGERLVPASAGDYFLPVYGPQYSLFWAPFALLPYAWAAALWMLLSAAIYAVCCYAIWRTCPNLHSHASTVALAAAAFPGFFSLITFGQNSALALAAFTAAYFALRARRDLLAGFCLGLLAYKPQLAIVPACVFVVQCMRPQPTSPQPKSSWANSSPGNNSPAKSSRAKRFGVAQRFSAAIKPEIENAALAAEGNPSENPRLAGFKVILGAILSLSIQLAITCAWYGRAPLLAYAHVLTHISSVSKNSRAQALPNALAPRLLEPASALAICGFWFLCSHRCRYGWPRHRQLERARAAPSPFRRHAPHDGPGRASSHRLRPRHPRPRFPLDRRLSRRRSLAAPAWLLYLSFLLPFAGPLAIYTHLQLSVICLAALTLTLAANTAREGFYRELRTGN